MLILYHSVNRQLLNVIDRGFSCPTQLKILSVLLNLPRKAKSKRPLTTKETKAVSRCIRYLKADYYRFKYNIYSVDLNV